MGASRNMTEEKKSKRKPKPESQRDGKPATEEGGHTIPAQMI